MNYYHPNPVDTSDVQMPDELLALTEKIAENTHDLWAVGRLREGWSYGEKRDDDAKTTPCLVPYDELPDSEKVYDRTASMETIKLIVKLWYKIEKGE